MKIFLLLTFFSLFSLFSPAQITFQKTYGGSAPDNGMSAVPTNDGGYIVGGSTNSFGAGSSDLYLIKTNANGDTLWTKTFGTFVDEWGFSVRQTFDGGYIFSGGSYLIKTDANGDTLWTRYLQGGGETCIQQTVDSGFVIAGPNGVIHVIKTNSSGDTLWSNVLSINGYEYEPFIQQTMDGGYILTGLTDNFALFSYQIFLMKLSPNGSMLWLKIFDGNFDDVGKCVRETDDGGFILTGWTTSFGNGNGKVFLIKTNSVGDIIWSKIYGGTLPDGGNYLQLTNDHGYIISGYTNSFSSGQDDTYLIKTDSLGSVLWSKNYGGSMNERGYSVEPTNDGGYIIGGETYSFGQGHDEVYLIKTDSLGNSGCHEGTPATITSVVTFATTTHPVIEYSGTVQNYGYGIIGGGSIVTTLCGSTVVGDVETSNFFSLSPNPTSSFFTINFTTQLQNGPIEIYNLLGEKIYSSAQSKIKNRKSEMRVDVSAWAPGIYFVKVQSDPGSYREGSAVQKLVIQ